MCECILVLFANIFLAIRVHSLTKSRFQCGLIIALSMSAFGLGMLTTTIAWCQTSKPSFLVNGTMTPQAKGMAATWHGLQAISECLITILLARALLKSRSGLRSSDTVVNYLIRNVIQIGFFAMLWAIGELVTWFFLPKSAIYTIFDTTTGSLYTHLIYDTLLSRVQLRQHLIETAHTEMGLPTLLQLHPRALKGRRASSVFKLSGRTNSIIETANLSSVTTNVSGAQKTVNRDVSEIEFSHAEESYNVRAELPGPLPAP